jgi:hypothetical protein
MRRAASARSALAAALALCVAAARAAPIGAGSPPPPPPPPPPAAGCASPEPTWLTSAWWPPGAVFRCGCGLTAAGTVATWNDVHLCAALGDFLYATGGPEHTTPGQQAPTYTFSWVGWPLSGWSDAAANVGADYCAFFSFTCDVSLTGVTNARGYQGLALDNFNMTGTVPASFAALAAFPAINLLGIGSQGLTLDPALLLPFAGTLEYLSLSRTTLLGGTLPPELGSLTRLGIFAASSCGITGTLPASMGSLTALSALTLSTNALQGSIPDAWGSLSLLQYLSLDHNAMSGALPNATLCAMSALINVDLSANSFSGSIPSLACLRLAYLDLKNNQLSGSIPAELATVMDCAPSDPTQLGPSSPQTASLGLAGNFLTGDIPASLTAKKCIWQLALQSAVSVCAAGSVQVTSADDNNLAWQRASCAACPSGTFSSSPGAVMCTQCEPGFFSVPNGTACAACAAGSVLDGATCTPCPGGTYSQGASLACVACQTNTYSAADAASCLSCPDGSTSGAGVASLASCACAAGSVAHYTADNSTFTCVACAAGSYHNVTAGECRACGYGSYSAVARATACTPVDAGFAATANGTGQVPCEAGFFLAGSSQAATPCERCAGGTYSLRASLACVACQSNTYAAADATSCLSCPDGSASGVGSPSLASCACAAGSVAKYTADNSTFTCVACAAGSYHDAGAGECRACGAGFYSVVARATACTPVDAGFVAFANGTGQAPCEAGTYLNGAACVPCAPGMFAAATGARACSLCPAGTIAPAAGATSCDECPASSSDSEVHTTCVCVAEYFDTQLGANATAPACAACAEGGACAGGVLLAQEGWWRETPTDAVFLKCREGYCLTEAADGGADGATATTARRRLAQAAPAAGHCADGHAGVLCAVCQEGYTMQGGFCQPCQATDAWDAWSPASRAVTVAFFVPAGALLLALLLLLPLLPAWERVLWRCTAVLAAAAEAAVGAAAALVRCCRGRDEEEDLAPARRSSAGSAGRRSSTTARWSALALGRASVPLPWQSAVGSDGAAAAEEASAGEDGAEAMDTAGAGTMDELVEVAAALFATLARPGKILIKCVRCARVLAACAPRRG